MIKNSILDAFVYELTRHPLLAALVSSMSVTQHEPDPRLVEVRLSVEREGLPKWRGAFLVRPERGHVSEHARSFLREFETSLGAEIRRLRERDEK